MRSSYRGQSQAIHSVAGAVIDGGAHRTPSVSDAATPKYRGRAVIRVLEPGGPAQVLDDFNRTAGDDPLCTSRDGYRYQRVVPDSTFSTSSTGDTPLSIDGAQMILRLPVGASSASMRARLVLPFSRLDRAIVEFDFRSTTPDFVPPDGVSAGMGVNLEATLEMEVGGATFRIGEVVQVYAYPPSIATLFHQFVDVDNGDVWLDDHIQLAHALSHGSLRNGAHVTLVTSRVTSGVVRLDVVLDALDGARELANVTSGRPNIYPIASSITYSRLVVWEEADPTDTVELVISGTCARSGGAGPYDLSDISWRLDNLDVTTDDVTSTPVPKC